MGSKLVAFKNMVLNRGVHFNKFDCANAKIYSVYLASKQETILDCGIAGFWNNLEDREIIYMYNLF